MTMSCVIFSSVYESMCSGRRNMLISVATSVLRDGAQQDVPSRPAVTTPSEMKRCNTKAALVGQQDCGNRKLYWNGNGGYRWLMPVFFVVFFETIQKDDDKRTSWVVFTPLVQLVCAENIIQSDWRSPPTNHSNHNEARHWISLENGVVRDTLHLKFGVFPPCLSKNKNSSLSFFNF